jgi:hypothetical protein
LSRLAVISALVTVALLFLFGMLRFEPYTAALERRQPAKSWLVEEKDAHTFR